MRLVVCLCVCAIVAAVPVHGRRYGGGGGSRGGGNRGGGYSRPQPKPPSRPPTRVDTSINNHFLNNERGSSAGGSTNQNPKPFNTPTAPKYPNSPPVHTNGPVGFDKVNSPSAPKPPSVQTNGPLGFDKVNGAGNQQGSPKIGFDKVNSEAQQNSKNPHLPSAPPYQGTPNGPPPPYQSGTYTGNSYSGAGDHPPAYPGRPVNAPPSYSAGNPYNGQANPSQPGYGNSYPGQQGFGNSFGSSYPQQNQFGGVGHSSYPSGGSSYPSNTGFFPMGGNSFGGNYPHSNSYQGNSYGGSPFSNNGYNSNPNPYYNTNSFGYSSNPGYFGNQGGYSSYPGQYDNNYKKSRFGGLPIPIPIPIPIPLGGFGGFGSGFGGYSHNHRLLDTFIKNQNSTQTGNSSTSVFILNNSTVTPCTTDHFVYDLVKVSVVACTAEHCTAIKLYSTTNISNVVTVHSASVTMCFENNVTFSYYGDNVTPTISELHRENITVCRDVPSNATTNTNETTKIQEATTLTPTTVDATTTQETTTETPTTISSVSANTTKICESVDCSHVEMCLPTIEVVDKCTTADCPFTRTGFKSCVTIKMCHSPTTPVSTFATLNTTISKIDEYNRHNSKFDAANLTLISYHRPVVNFDCPLNGTAPGCPTPVNPPQLPCVPGNSTQSVANSTASTNTSICSPPVTLSVNSTSDATQSTTVAQ